MNSLYIINFVNDIYHKYYNKRWLVDDVCFVRGCSTTLEMMIGDYHHALGIPIR
jgi:hypothetical protein